MTKHEGHKACAELVEVVTKDYSLDGAMDWLLLDYQSGWAGTTIQILRQPDFVPFVSFVVKGLK